MRKILIRKISRWVIPVFIVAIAVKAFLSLFVVGKNSSQITAVVTMVNLVASIATVVGLGVAIWQYLSAISKQEKAYLNAIFDEIKINLRIRRREFFPAENESYYSQLYETRLKGLPKDSEYENPTDGYPGDQKRKELYAVLEIDPLADDLLNRYHLPISNYAIKSVLANGFVYGLLPARIIINLGHLNYAIDRNNIRLKDFNKLVSDKGLMVKSGGFLADYLDWVHFRSYFIMMDMVTSFGERSFVDKREYRRIKALCK
jgi:hypothetical protein